MTTRPRFAAAQTTSQPPIPDSKAARSSSGTFYRLSYGFFPLPEVAFKDAMRQMGEWKMNHKYLDALIDDADSGQRKLLYITPQSLGNMSYQDADVLAAAIADEKPGTGIRLPTLTELQSFFKRACSDSDLRAKLGFKEASTGFRTTEQFWVQDDPIAKTKLPDLTAMGTLNPPEWSNLSPRQSYEDNMRICVAFNGTNNPAGLVRRDDHANTLLVAENPYLIKR